MYLVKTPWVLKKIFPNYFWDMFNGESKIYLSFDDGPHPIATPFVLDVLKEYNAKATFFCIGKNVELYRDIYQRIIDEGHSVGNHTQNHLNGWKSKDEDYLADINKANKTIDSNLYRPPYGKITGFQAKVLQKMGYKIVMWDVLSGDFDIKLSKENCADNVILQAKSGSIIVFHDSQKAWERLVFALPKVLKNFAEKGFEFDRIIL